MRRVQIFILLANLLAIIDVQCVAAKGNCHCDNLCGLQRISTRIVGGMEPHPHSHPWAVALIKNDILYCGATIVSKNFILTAAHCIYSFAPKEILILIGSHKLKDRSMTRNVKTIVHHERFDVVTFNNDIGLIELNTPLPFGQKIKPACLPDYRGTSRYSGKLGLIFGWGREGENEESSNDRIKYTYVPIWSQQKCSQFGYGPKRLTSNMICAGYENGGYDACQGDSGGSMLQLLPSGGAEVIGIISWGRGCARPNFPGIYTIVGKYRLWLERHITADCKCG